jgi:hypothetical protein
VTSGHFIFIPAVLMVGIIVGFLFGTRAAADRMNLERKREAEREEARERRAERKARRKAAKDEADDDEADEKESA